MTTNTNDSNAQRAVDPHGKQARLAIIEKLKGWGIESNKAGTAWVRNAQGVAAVEGVSGSAQIRVEIHPEGRPPTIDPRQDGQAELVLAWFDSACTLEEAIDEVARQANEWMRKAKEDNEEDSSKLGKTMGKALQAGGSLPEISERLQQAYEQWSANWRVKLQAKELESRLSLDDYPLIFPMARQLKREIEIFTGPTNSGKTYAGMQLLAQAKSGAYLAPLRLLAMEGQEAIQERGLSCSLVTGEERRIEPGDRFVASTVEMADFNTAVDVAVIDEAQMLADKDRGWAWTAAIIGMPAKKLAIVCAPEALGMVQALLARTGETVKVHKFERKTPLDAVSKALSFGDLHDGDALIAFSRKNALTWRDKVAASGKSVAVIYGALAPEVRRSEAKRFAEGKAQILVATDAIGMGLNLPIKRVVFTTAVKFDGEETRELDTQEVRQIAGRAGRYGIAERGFACALDQGDARIVGKALAGGVVPLAEKAIIAPNDRQVELMSEAMGTDRLATILCFFRDHLVKSDTLFKAGAMEDMMDLAWRADRRLKLGLQERFAYAKTPLDRNDLDHLKIWEGWMRSHEDGREVKAPVSPMAARSSRDEDRLWECERAMKLLSAYCWLSWRYEAVFPERAEAEAARADLSVKIEAMLARASQAQQRSEKNKTHGGLHKQAGKAHGGSKSTKKPKNGRY